MTADNNMKPDDIEIRKSLDLLIAPGYKENTYFLS